MPSKYKTAREKVMEAIENKIISLFREDPLKEFSYHKVINELALSTGASHLLVKEVFKMYFETEYFVENRLFNLHPKKIKEFGEDKLKRIEEVKEEVKEEVQKEIKEK